MSPTPGSATTTWPGRLGVAVLDAMLDRKWVTDEFAVTDKGDQELQGIGIETSRLRGTRALTRPCPDWTERRTHLAGALGAALGSTFLDLGWVRKRPSGRGLDVTPSGVAALGEIWGISLGSA